MGLGALGDVSGILSAGALGLSFLLAFLSYRLLAQNQRIKDGNPQSVLLIKIFIIFSGLLAIIGFSFEFMKFIYARDDALPMADAGKFWISVRIEDSEGRPLKGIEVNVTELAQDGKKKRIFSEKSSDAGSVNFPLTLNKDSKVSVTTGSSGYLGQELILQPNAITFPARLTKEAGHGAKIIVSQKGAE